MQNRSLFATESSVSPFSYEASIGKIEPYQVSQLRSLLAKARWWSAADR